MTNTLKQLAELRAKATQEEWSYDYNNHHGIYWIETPLTGSSGVCDLYHTVLTSSGGPEYMPKQNCEANAAFIAAAGNFDFAKAAAEKTALEERVKRLEEALREIASQKTVSELTAEWGATNWCNFEAGYDEVVAVARTTLENSND